MPFKSHSSFVCISVCPFVLWVDGLDFVSYVSLGVLGIYYSQFGLLLYGTCQFDGVSCWQGRFWNLPELELVHWELVHRGVKPTLVVTVHFYTVNLFTWVVNWIICVSVQFICVCVFHACLLCFGVIKPLIKMTNISSVFEGNRLAYIRYLRNRKAMVSKWLPII